MAMQMMNFAFEDFEGRVVIVDLLNGKRISDEETLLLFVLKGKLVEKDLANHE